MIKVSLKNISKVINSGLTPLRSNQEFWLNGNIPWVKTEQLGEKYINDSNEKITEYALESTSIKLNPKNTLSIAMYGEGKTRGSVSILKNETTTNQACCNIVIDQEKAEYEYVYYFLKTQYDNLRNLSSGVRKNLNSNDIKNFEIRLPNLKTQKQIAKILSDLDSKIEINNKINQALEAMAKTLYDYWFVQFDFPDANGKPYKSSGGKMVFNKELRREIPEGWEVKTLLDIAKFTNGLACQKFRPEENEDSYKVIKIREMGSGFTDNSEFVSINIPEKVIINNGDILFSWSATLDVKIWTGGKGALNQHIFKITSKKFPRSYYFFELLNYLQHFKMQAELRKTTMGHITQEHLKQSRITIPPIELINKLDRIIKPILNKKTKLDEENQKLAELRDWLLPMLMNGQATVGSPVEKRDIASLRGTARSDFSEKQSYEGNTNSMLGMVAEAGIVYEKNKTSVNTILESINYDYEVAVVVLLTRQRLNRTYGKKYIHKMFSNIKFLENLPVFNDLEFQENGWGMYCPVLTKTIDNQKLIYFDDINDEFSVINFKYKHIREVNEWMEKDNYNKRFVIQVNNMLSIYEKPLINKNMDRIELFNTVLECMYILETDNFDSVWNKMEHWKMFEDDNKTKAEKFKQQETKLMIGLIKDLKR